MTLDSSNQERLKVAVRDTRGAQQELRRAEAARNHILAAAHERGATLFELAKVLDVTPQRVGQILEGLGSRRATLHEAMVEILREHGGWLEAHRLARAIYERDLYRRRDRTVLAPAQVRARAVKYPELFETTTDGSGQIRLV